MFVLFDGILMFARETGSVVGSECFVQRKRETASERPVDYIDWLRAAVGLRYVVRSPIIDLCLSHL